MTRFLIDADCPRSIGNLLKSLGYEVFDIRDIIPETSDQEIYELIKKERFIFITRDTDFGNILRYPVTSQCGIILLRVNLLSVNEIVEIIKDILFRIPEKEMFGSLIVARKGRYRIHKI